MNKVDKFKKFLKDNEYNNEVTEEEELKEKVRVEQKADSINFSIDLDTFNEFIMKKEYISKDKLQDILHKEKELTRAQTEYDMNEIWKDKIREKIEEGVPFEKYKDKYQMNFVDYNNGYLQALYEVLEGE